MKLPFIFSLLISSCLLQAQQETVLPATQDLQMTNQQGQVQVYEPTGRYVQRQVIIPGTTNKPAKKVTFVLPVYRIKAPPK